MELLISSLTLIVAAALSLILQRHFFKNVAINYIDMLLGAIIALIPWTNHLIAAYNPEIFMGLIIAPLLYYEGQAIRLNGVFHKRKIIFNLTVTMVLICAIAAAASVYAVVGSVALAAVLAAISTPTDATATEAVTNGLIVPEKQNNALKMESLFNDASGIILLNMSILWYVRGQVSVTATIGSFLYSAVGGILVGFVLSALIVLFTQALQRSAANFQNHTYNSSTPIKVIYLLAPFLIYYVSEEIGVSGIIAAVCGGLVQNAGNERSRLTNPKITYDSSSLISFICDLFNSSVFLILGIAMVRVVTSKIHYASINWLIVGVLLYLANLLVRYLYARFLKQDNYHAWVFALGGIHGAVTFALAYTVAETRVQTADFNLIIMSESILIILSLIVPTIIFKFILPKEPSTKIKDQKIHQVRQDMVQRAIDRIKQIYLPDDLRELILFDLNAQKANTTLREFAHAWLDNIRHPELNDEERDLFIMAYREAFRKELDYLSEIGQRDVLYHKDLVSLYREVVMAQMVISDDD
jgi:NhaP-type Na+/H+ or K+/H+ antiporter